MRKCSNIYGADNCQASPSTVSRDMAIFNVMKNTCLIVTCIIAKNQPQYYENKKTFSYYEGRQKRFEPKILLVNLRINASHGYT